MVGDLILFAAYTAANGTPDSFLLLFLRAPLPQPDLHAATRRGQ